MWYCLREVLAVVDVMVLYYCSADDELKLALRVARRVLKCTGGPWAVGGVGLAVPSHFDI